MESNIFTKEDFILAVFHLVDDSFPNTVLEECHFTV